jgi:uncharacterized membrane protein YphA (DoxX/SURF4 family)
MFRQRSRDAAFPCGPGLGLIFVVHGAQKLFGWFGESAVGDQQIEAAIEIFSEAVARVDRARAA